MNTAPELIVMLTHHDRTVENAYNVFDQSKYTQAQYWGLKEIGIPPAQMRRLCDHMKAHGKTVVLEVVQYTEAECLAGAKAAAECGCDYLMGTMYFDSVHRLCADHGIRYMPFVGQISGRPSVLGGTVEEMVCQARSLMEKGVYGIDLLGYRFTGDPVALNDAVIRGAGGPVCLAGSINSRQRLEEVKRAAPRMFTIGGAFFEGRFGDTFSGQIQAVRDFMAEQPPAAEHTGRKP